ncbi:hypothetical protein [Spiroplasma poulsonii]|uniref:hypothetical protein n=1 Tax=Spiroplasma poulsonii TaxID=2138 RepID=UPI001F4CC0BD|nr:hypothetical protein [Spiroplasma poulsonii]UNF62709.1 hypothetical protein MNU24_08260 [Spiroplasma poulsonii]
MCFIDKTGKYFLVGLDMYFTYWIYNTRDNNKYRLAGYQAIKDTAIKELHYLTVSARRYEKEQATNPFLSGLTYQQAREQICAESDKLKAEYQTYVKTKYSANKNIKNETRENNSLVDDYNTSIIYFMRKTKNKRRKGWPHPVIELNSLTNFPTEFIFIATKHKNLHKTRVIARQRIRHQDMVFIISFLLFGKSPIFIILFLPIKDQNKYHYYTKTTYLINSIYFLSKFSSNFIKKFINIVFYSIIIL